LEKGRGFDSLAHFSYFAIWFTREFNGLGVFEDSDELLGLENWPEFNVAVFCDEIDPLTRPETQRAPNLLWDDDLKFG